MVPAGLMDEAGMDGWQLRFVYWQPLARHRQGRGMAAGTSEGS